MIFQGVVVDIPSVVNKIKYVSWGWVLGNAGSVGGASISDWWITPLSCITNVNCIS